MNKKLSALGLLSLLLVVTYCSNNYFGRVLTRNSSIEPDVTVTPIDVPDGGDPNLNYVAVDATFQQPEVGTQLVNPEIVFVMDTSGSMADERSALINSLEGWLTTLETSGFNNYCVGVMRAAFTGANTGRMVTNGTNARCLCRDSGLNASQIATRFNQNISSINIGGGSEEAGILSLHNALNDSAKLSANQTDGCFRSDMVLVPIFIADENDMGATVREGAAMCGGGNNATRSDGTTTTWNTIAWDNSYFTNLDGFVTSPATAPKYVNNSCDEAQVRLRYYSEATPTGPGGTYQLTVTPKTVADDVIEYNGDLPTYGTAIIYNSTTFPANGTESKGWGYNNFADELGFATANLATANPNTQAAFNSQMNEIATALTQTLQAVRIFTLNPKVCAGFEDSLVVRVNNTVLTTPAQYTLNSARTKVTIKPQVNIPTGAAMGFEYIGCQ